MKRRNDPIIIIDAETFRNTPPIDMVKLKEESDAIWRRCLQNIPKIKPNFDDYRKEREEYYRNHK